MLTSAAVHGISEWQSVAINSDADDLREHILTGYKSGKPFTPYVPTIPVPSSIDWVLDFGCGVGRSFPYLRAAARHVVGFDLPPMIARCRALAPVPVDLLSDDWASVSSKQFDMVFAALVLQHVEPEACRMYLADFARIAPVTYLLTRLQSDFGENVLGIVSNARLFDVEACAEVEHDASTHTLRQVGQPPFAAISRATDNRHYEVKLRSTLIATQTR